MTGQPLFSPQVITAVAEVVTGGSGTGSVGKRYGTYRSGPRLETFFGSCDVELHIGSGSRVPAVRSALTTLNQQREFEKLRRVIEGAVDPRDFAERPDDHKEALDYLNAMLGPDGYELRLSGARYRLESVSASSVMTRAVEQHAAALDYDSVQRDTERAIEQAETDPEGSITAACSMVESVCRCILNEMNEALPAKKDISHLVAEAQKHLNLSPSRADIAPDIKQILGGLSNVASGIGALRTHAGSAHGRDKATPRADGRTARLAIHAASTIALFFIETWRASREIPS